MWLVLFSLVCIFLFYRWLRELRRVPEINKKYVFITGCDSGFGHLLAKHLDQLGFRVFAGCFTEKGQDELKKSTSDKLVTFHLDVTKSDSIRKAAELIKSTVGEAGLWGVVNNAGVSVPAASCDWLNIEDYRQMLDINTFGVIEVTLSVLQLIKKARGRIVNMASVFGRISPVGGPYCVSKYAVEAFNDCTRIDMKPFGVKVCCIEPGFFKTTITDSDVIERNLRRIWERLPGNIKEDYGSDFLEKALKLSSETLKKLPDANLMKVVSCMEHAIAAMHPRTRYSPGWDAKFFWLPLSYMPTVISDYVMTMKALKPAKAVV
ncbi:retinol dehydrogenase 7 [Erpetoichthys calabaricus]|uniref:Dehydrogenase/reductase (SDR family) member 9 n=1 Tax=Erpetoichthys calabaricus TaxID=27687 RepID=A0A8C4T852_ERPCA|nr:retinol dehydrogenase 7 [Erpetoichthys calabaricus]